MGVEEIDVDDATERSVTMASHYEEHDAEPRQHCNAQESVLQSRCSEKSLKDDGNDGFEAIQDRGVVMKALKHPEKQRLCLLVMKALEHPGEPLPDIEDDLLEATDRLLESKSSPTRFFAIDFPNVI
ncbi:unnamed protein product [Citrullus colocynthis]|uniref:Uncharacterized protein n=1 Tax=Citrullus colocynthis TaxID=252529 RepID=A0ABP0XS93_9ROSI